VVKNVSKLNNGLDGVDMNLARLDDASMKFIRSNIKASPKANICHIKGYTTMSSFFKTLV
jgi:hypothetical protein